MGKKERTLMIVAGTAPFIFGCTAVDYGFALLSIAGIVTTLGLAMLHINRNRKNARKLGTANQDQVENALNPQYDDPKTNREIYAAKDGVLQAVKKRNSVTRGGTNEDGFTPPPR